MKKRWLFALSMLCAGALLFTSASSARRGAYVPIFMERSELEKSVSWKDESRELKNPGKIYYKEPYIFVNERYKGVHVIDNTDPKHPVQTAFIVAPGCIDMAIKGEVLYLDNAVDLVAFDLNARKEVHRVKEVFPEPHAPDNSYGEFNDRPEGFVLVGWK